MYYIVLIFQEETIKPRAKKQKKSNYIFEDSDWALMAGEKAVNRICIYPYWIWNRISKVLTGNVIEFRACDQTDRYRFVLKIVILWTRRTVVHKDIVKDRICGAWGAAVHVHFRNRYLDCGNYVSAVQVGAKLCCKWQVFSREDVLYILLTMLLFWTECVVDKL